MFQIAGGVFLGILAAVAILNWWQGRQERRLARLRDRLLDTRPGPPQPKASEFGGFGGLIFLGLATVLVILAVIALT